MKKLLAVLISIFMVMSLLAGCAPAETPQEDTPMEDQNPSNNGTDSGNPNSGNPLDEGPIDDGMEDMNEDPLNQENPDSNKDGSKGLNEEKLAMNDSSTEAFKILDEVLIETNNKGCFEVA